MKKFGFRCIALLVLLVVGLNFLNKFSLQPSDYTNTVNDFNDLIDQGKRVDVFFYGSSHACYSYDPNVIDSITKIRSFNFGMTSQRLNTTDFVFRETLKKSTPKLIVLDVFPFSLKHAEKEQEIANQKKAYYAFTELSINKIRAIVKNFPLEEIPNTIFPVLRKSDKVSTLFFKRKERYVFSPEEKVVKAYRGFIGNGSYLKKENFVPFEIDDFNESNSSNYNFLSETEKNALDSFLELAKRNNIEVLVVVAPYMNSVKDKEYKIFHNYIKNITIKRDAAFIDFNFLFEDLKLNHIDFKDIGHLNVSGAKKISTFLGNYIRENYKISSRENELSWVEEQPKSVTKYIQDNFIEEAVQINTPLNKDFNIKAISFYDKGIEKNVIFKLDNTVTDSILSKYRIGFHTYVKDTNKDDLMAYSKSKKRNYDAWDFIPEIMEVGGNKYILKKINTSINEFPKIELFLYDRNGYKGILGNKVEIENIIIK